MSDFQIVKAERKKARLRLALAGPSGSGKTWSALAMATGLGGRIAVIDTEHESASLYADEFTFDTLSLKPPYSPERYIAAVEAIEKAGYDVCIIDSYSHEWSGSGGCLEINEALAGAKYKGNTWSAWNETTPRHRKLIDKILASPMHIIATMRSKTETVQGENKKVMKLGMKSEQREGTDYEFTTVLDLQHDTHIATTSKDRTHLFTEPFVITVDTGKTLLNWLGAGVDPLVRATQLVEGLIADINAAPNMDALQAAFIAARAEARAYPALADRVMSAKDARKTILQPAPPAQPEIAKPTIAQVQATSQAAAKAMKAVRDAIIVDIGKALHPEDFDALDARIAVLVMDDRDFCYDALEQRHIELEAHAREFIAPAVDDQTEANQNIPDVLLEEPVQPRPTEEELAADILGADSIERIDHVIRIIEKHDIVAERTRLLKDASAKRRKLKNQEEAAA